MGKDKGAKMQKAGFSVKFKTWLMTFTKKKKKEITKWTCDNYNAIFLLKSQVQKMVSKSQKEKQLKDHYKYTHLKSLLVQ